MTIVTNEPAHEGEQELAKRRVDIEEIGSFQVLLLDQSEGGSARTVQLNGELTYDANYNTC